jgi:hypothetical protein
VPTYQIEDDVKAGDKKTAPTLSVAAAPVQSGGADSSQGCLASVMVPNVLKNTRREEALKARGTLRNQFVLQDYIPDDHPEIAIQNGFDALRNTSPDQDFTPIFLAHAQLYTFAEKRLIAPLKRLTISNSTAGCRITICFYHVSATS